MEEPLSFGHFEVLTRSDGSPQVLGRGGMGVTYKALDRNLLSWVVIKVLGAQHEGTPGARQRFLQEARLMARLRHPHVASVFYFGESEAGAFYAMEFCEGSNLQEFMEREGVLQWQEVFRLAFQAASALLALEALELVHRDLKPSNMILTRDSAGTTQLKLIDFGVAREGAALENGITQGGFVGTPLYASPEQLLEAGNLDARSDFYSLGAVMWFCMTARPPFAGTAFEVMFHHVNTEPDWSQLPEMPEAALLLMKRLLGKSAQERPENPTVLCAELQKLIGEQGGTPLQLPVMPRKKEETEGGYQLLEQRPGDGFGQLWRTRDVLTGRIVALRIMPSQFSARQGLVLRAQRLAACVRGVEHDHWQRVWHFEQNGDECRLATQWIAGPSLLALLKVRQTLGLAEAVMLLTQAAEAMDFGVSVGLSTMDTAMERMLLEVEGWETKNEDECAQWLREPVGGKSDWNLKMCPMRMGVSPHDYVLPTDAEASQAAARMAQDFVQMCFRLLTGQGRESAGFVPSPALKAEGNAFFEKRMGVNAAALGVSSCRHQLSLLCLAEGVSASHLLGSQEDALATRVVTNRQQRPTEDMTLIVGVTPKFRNTQPMGSAAGIGATAKLKELEQRRQQLELEADQLRAEGRLEAEREWIAQEREGLEKAREKIAVQEAERNERVRQEQERLAEQRKAVEQQQALLEEKRQEQLRLEQELQARAQAEFQRLQEDARHRESQLQAQHAEAEEALKKRESEFLARERESIAKLEVLKQESASLEQHVQAEARALHDSQLKQDRLVREHTTSSPIDPTLEDFLNNRYAVVAKLPPISAAHQRYELRSAMDSSVRFILSYCPYQQAPAPTTLERQKKLAALMMKPTLPLLCQAVEFHFANTYHFVISGFPGEQSLREVLQNRRALPVTEVEPILRLLGEACETAASLSWPRLSVKAQDLYLDSRIGYPRVVVPDVPVFDAVGYETEGGDAMRTRQFSVSDLADWNDPVPKGAGEYVSLLAELCCDLLGHPQNTRSGHGRFQPIAQLSSQQNGLLRKALANDLQATFTSARVFLEMFFGKGSGFEVAANLEHLRAVAEATGGLTPKPPPLLFDPNQAGKVRERPPSTRSGRSQTTAVGPLVVRDDEWMAAEQSKNATRLRLIPQSEEATALALVADAGILLGRSMTDADFVAQFRPRSARNDTRSRRIGRAQAQLQPRGDVIGFEEKSPLNPSLSGENGLPMESTAECGSPCAILLAGEYPLEVHRVPTAYPKGRPLSVANWKETGALNGGLVARPGGPEVLLWETGLVLSDVGLLVSASGRAHLQVHPSQEAVGRFHHLNGQFWLEAISESMIKTAEGKPMKAREMLLLRDELRLSIGRHAYAVHFYSIHAAAETR